MTNEELKKKIADELRKSMEPIEYGGDSEHAPEVHHPTEEEIAHTLIAAGLRFGENFTATFDHMALDREHELEHRLAEAEHRAEVAEKEAIILSKWLADKTRKNYPYQVWLEAAQKQAEKELKGESKK